MESKSKSVVFGEVSAKTVKQAGYAKFNEYRHMCITVPDGGYTISCRTSDGKKITFSFMPYKDGGPAECVDIYHESGIPHKDRDDLHLQSVICFNGGRDSFRSTPDKTVTLTTLLLHK